MARKKVQAAKEERTWSFANIKLDEHQRAAFGEWQNTMTIDDVWVNVLPDLLIEHKVSLNYVAENDHYTCSITGKEGTPNSRITLSSFAQNIEDSILISVFKFTEIAGSDLTPFVGQNREREAWG